MQRMGVAKPDWRWWFVPLDGDAWDMDAQAVKMTARTSEGDGGGHPSAARPSIWKLISVHESPDRVSWTGCTPNTGISRPPPFHAPVDTFPIFGTEEHRQDRRHRLLKYVAPGLPAKPQQARAVQPGSTLILPGFAKRARRPLTAQTVAVCVYAHTCRLERATQETRPLVLCLFRPDPRQEQRSVRQSVRQ